jgi:hypothetical protein
MALMTPDSPTKYEKHVYRMKCMIAASSIARQCHDKTSSGAGAPTADDMRDYAQEAEAIAELWESTQ